MPQRPYQTGKPELDKAILDLAQALDGGVNGQLIDEIFTTAIKLSMDHADRGDLKIINTTLKEMRHVFRIFKPYRGVRKVSIFGSARTPQTAPEYHQAYLISKRLAELDFMVVTGAGGGIMRAGHEGAGRDKSFGVNIRLPFEQGANSVIAGSPLLINFKYFFTRKLAFIKEVDAVLCLPGGFGTHDEGFESLTLVQTGKSRMMPIVFLDAPGGKFWRAWDDYVRNHLLANGMISEGDLALYKVTDDAEEACQEIVTFYNRYNSSRFVADQLVIRVKGPIPDGLVDSLNRDFTDIVKGPITVGAALPQEADEPALADLPRLILDFNRRHYGRLRQLIDRINTFGSPPPPENPGLRAEVPSTA